MKKIACIVFELEENEKVEDLVRKIENSCNKECYLNTELEQDWRKKLTNLLHSLKINISLKGCSVIFDMMEAVEKNPSYKSYCNMKELYAYVSQKTGRPYAQLERNIRHLTKKIFDLNSEEDVNEKLQSFDVTEYNITNSSFIALLIERIF